MKIKSFTIRNFKNIRFAKCDDVPDFLVICGSNGSGKSSILEAIMAAKRTASNKADANVYKNYVSGHAHQSEVELNIELPEEEITETNSGMAPHLQAKNKKKFTIKLTIAKNGASSIVTEPNNFTINTLTGISKDSGFFDYFSAHRENKRTEISLWNPASTNAQNVYGNLDNGSNKYSQVKNYLSALKMGDLQNLQRSQLAGEIKSFDSLKEIRVFFNGIFSPMRFNDVYIDRTPFYFEIETPAGSIDIDDLSSGEKEILNTYIHFHQLATKGSIILMDEPDAHLHPELQKRYLEVLKNIGQGNQLMLTTHSPEMMAAAGSEALYTVIKFPKDINENQFVQVSGNEKLHQALTEVMGTSGFVSLNRKIIFIEGESASTDVEFYSKLFPANQYNTTFVPAGDSTMLKAVSDKVFYLLEQGDGFQQFYCIIDGDIENRHQATDRLFKLPVYHVENYLLEEVCILKVCRMLLGAKSAVETVADVTAKLHEAVMSDQHLRSYTRSLLDSQIYAQAENAKNLIFQGKFEDLKNIEKIHFESLMNNSKVIMEQCLKDGSWKQKCKGRDVLKEFCRNNQLKYEQLRNALIYNIGTPPPDLAVIIREIVEKV
ncbi:AAA family ATPase [Mucilaginibacter sp. KACC 22773]|uniref:AAA family ATPase n=1 Tax=Mucilaginibacter sp. KACC 22773 TaxID=3025671 RepID=UPI00236576E8|nr:AAA family ATPase [Mucilaginibacter sp. KACC 22773]WDF79105.1 AAA family ATPase [Mucilaginibacter sp. KACC 22773]